MFIDFVLLLTVISV